MGSFDAQVFAEVKRISRKLDSGSSPDPYTEQETLSKASEVSAFGSVLEIAGQEFDHFFIRTDGNLDDISYIVKNTRGGLTEEIEASKFPYVPGPVQVIRFKNDVAESGKSIFVLKVRGSYLPILPEQAKLVPHFRSGGFNLDNSTQGKASRSENQSESTRVSYTVPTGQRARLDVHLNIVGEIAATSTTTTDSLGNFASVVPAGDFESLIIDNRVNTVAYAAGLSSKIDGHWWLNAGDALKVQNIFEGDAAGAGRVLMIEMATIEEFDA